MKKIIALLGALDTKGAEYAFIKECIEATGCQTLLIDVGTRADPAVAPDITREEVAAAGGGTELLTTLDRGTAISQISRGAAVLIPKLYAEKRFDGILAMGGTGGTSVACAAMRALPLGIPKVIVSTVAGGDVSAYLGGRDIVMIPSIVDIAGINRVSREVLSRAAGAVCGMTMANVPVGEDRPLIAASMFGNTTPAVEHAKAILEQAGYEVLVFHATGSGGRTLEALVEAGLVAGVLDITTTEWADELIGGVFSAGPKRLEGAARQGIPAIVAPGCLDMVNFWAPPTVPAKFAERRFYPHNPNVTLMRTNPAENQQLGRILAEKLNLSVGPVTVLLPGKGLSMIDAPGGPFWWPEANTALFSSLKRNLRADIPVIELDCNINDPAFAERCALCLLANLSQTQSSGGSRLDKGVLHA